MWHHAASHRRSLFNSTVPPPDRKSLKVKVKLSHSEAVDVLRQLQPLVDHAAAAGMEGIGWSAFCPICDSNAPPNQRKVIDVSLLMGEQPAVLSRRFNLTLHAAYKHRVHLLKAFWTHGMGARVEATGHWQTFPTDGDMIEKAKWYEGQFQRLAYLADQSREHGEVRRCLESAQNAGKLILLVQAGGLRPAAPEIAADQLNRLEEARAQRQKAVAHHEPVINVTAKTIELEAVLIDGTDTKARAGAAETPSVAD